MPKKYNYYKVIQGNYGYGWHDEDFHETNASFEFASKEDKELFKANYRAYRENCGGGYRIIKRRELVK
jgi:lipopolysaccharide assembly outer membrane protein LptD (OstA)